MAVLLALAVAGLLAISSLMQHGAASAIPHGETSPLEMMWRLMRSPRWVAAKCLDVLSLVLELLALARGSLVLFQTVMTSGIVIAVIAESRRAKRRLYKREVGGALAIVAGAGMVGLRQPHGPDAVVSLWGWFLACASATVIVATGLHLARNRIRYLAPMMGVATGVAYSLDVAFLKNATTAYKSDGLGRVAILSFFGYLAGAIVGNIMIHRAYQRAPLRASLPALTAVQPISALIIALLVLQEHLSRTPLGKTVIFVGVTLVVCGSLLASGTRDEAPVVAMPHSTHKLATEA
jgi:drug/metabolite transporter (DMT)-like permease